MQRLVVVVSRLDGPRGSPNRRTTREPTLLFEVFPTVEKTLV
jgi:hypothetical protein